MISENLGHSKNSKISGSYWSFGLFALWGAGAQAAPLPQVPADLIKDLESELAPHVITLSRDVLGSHWTHRSDVQIPITGPVPAADPKFKAYIERSSRSFNRLTRAAYDMLGPGLYLALDPVSTRQYGGKNFVLYQLAMKKGTRLLDFRNVNFSQPLVQKMRDFGCKEPEGTNVFYFRINQSSLEPCQSLRIAISQSAKLKASGVIYDYYTMTMPGCKHSPSAAILAWDSLMVNWASSAGLIRETTPSDSVTVQGLKKMIQRLGNEVASDFGLTPAEAQVFDIGADSSPASKVQTFVRKNLLGCGDHPEDKIVGSSG